MRDSSELRTSAIEALSAAARDFLGAQTPLLEAKQKLHTPLVDRLLQAYQEISPMLRLATAREQISSSAPVPQIQVHLGDVCNAFRVFEERVDDARRSAADVHQLLLGETMLRIHSARNLVEIAMKLLDLVNDPLRE